MTAILKVDEIQDTSGNNIINESSDTITIGASGDTVDVPGTEVKTNKVSPTSGTSLQIGDSGDTVNVVGTLQNNGAAVGGENTPAWKVSGNATSVANSTATKLTINTEQFDTDNKVASNKVTPGEGKFQVNIEIHAADNTDTDVFQIRFYKNGGWYQGAQMINRESNDVTMSLIIVSNSTDYWEVFCQQQTGSTINVNISEFSGFKLIGV